MNGRTITGNWRSKGGALWAGHIRDWLGHEMEQLPNRLWMNTWRFYSEGLACRWEPFGTEDCVNTITNGVCYEAHVTYGPFPVCRAVLEPMIVRRDFCAR